MTSSEELGARLAAFAVGCLGAPSPAKAGGKLGLMGSASEEEFRHVLCHLEVLARQRAAKLADTGFKATLVSGANGANGASVGASALPGGGVGAPTCSEAFATALREACGIGIAEMFTRLPVDGHGRADLLRVFGMVTSPHTSERVVKAEEDLGNSSAESSKGLQALSADVPADYVERAVDLPPVTLDAYAAAEEQLLKGGVAEPAWSSDLLAMNVLRSGLVRSAALGGVAVTSPLVVAISERCVSKRPALAKSALHALVELAEHGEGGEASLADVAGRTEGGVWADAAHAAFAACLGAARGTKLVARLAEDTLMRVAHRVAKEAEMPAAIREMVACISTEAGGRSPQPSVVSGGLRTLAALAPGLDLEPSSPKACEAQDAASAAAALCKDILTNRRLSPAFSQARAALQALSSSPVATSEAQGAREEGSVASTH